MMLIDALDEMASADVPPDDRSPGSGLRAYPFRLSRGGQAVLDGVELGLQPGAVLSVLGANGAGKSTLLSVLADELQAQALQAGPAVTLDGLPLETLGTRGQARQRAVLPQKPSLGFDLAVNDVVEMGGYPFPELEGDALHTLQAEAMALAGVEGFRLRPYSGLSGGEQQRVQFARVALQVLAARRLHPDSGVYLLLDEPTASLDPQSGRQVLAGASQLARHHGVGVLLILHDVNLAALWSDGIALLHRGRILARGRPRVVLTADNLRDVYGVDATVLAHPLHAGVPLVVFGR